MVSLLSCYLRQLLQSLYRTLRNGAGFYCCCKHRPEQQDETGLIQSEGPGGLSAPPSPAAPLSEVCVCESESEKLRFYGNQGPGFTFTLLHQLPAGMRGNIPLIVIFNTQKVPLFSLSSAVFDRALQMTQDIKNRTMMHFSCDLFVLEWASIFGKW